MGMEKGVQTAGETRGENKYKAAVGTGYIRFVI